MGKSESLPAPRYTKTEEPFIPYVPDEKVVERLGPVVQPYMKRMGFLPNALKLYAYRPEIAETGKHREPLSRDEHVHEHDRQCHEHDRAQGVS